MSHVRDLEQRIAQRATEPARVEQALRERERELHCVHAIVTMADAESPSLEAGCQRMLDLIPLAWENPEEIHVRATIADRVFVTPGFRETAWVEVADIRVKGEPVGVVEVHRPEDVSASRESASSVEKRRVLDIVAVRLGEIVQRHTAQDDLQRVSADLESLQWEREDHMARLEIIEQQRKAIRELFVPVLEVWDRVLLVSIVGVVDYQRAADITNELLYHVSAKGARFVIIDLAGVRTVDTSTASHLSNMVASVGLLGATCILTGIHGGVAQTMIALDINLTHMNTRSNLRIALSECIRRVKAQPP
jgi:anti-anti-sigma regulatory factor